MNTHGRTDLACSTIRPYRRKVFLATLITRLYKFVAFFGESVKIDDRIDVACSTSRPYRRKVVLATLVPRWYKCVTFS